jgi:drug/metabolite transporter superfamily protein YnfA
MTGKFQIIAEFWQFLKERKKWWLGPIVLMLLLLGLLMVLTQGSSVAPFVYALF